MPKTNISHNKRIDLPHKNSHFANIELVKWPSLSDTSIKNIVLDNVLAIQTTRLQPIPVPLKQELDHNLALLPSLSPPKEKVKSPFGEFNLGLHVGDDPNSVNGNRELLKKVIYQELTTCEKSNRGIANFETLKVQWLEQVHGNEVVTVVTADSKPIVADASITREKNIALAIMTADCLPILLTNIQGTEVAAIHGGWRPLAANIIGKTINKMKSKPSDIIAWLGPCIGHTAFEVGEEVKETFIQLDRLFEDAFVATVSNQGNSSRVSNKYLADLQKIARLQLTALGIAALTNLPECTYHQTNKYYSFRKEKKTGRMASLICLR